MVRAMTGDGGAPRIDDWNRLLDGRVAVVTGGGDGIGGGIDGLRRVAAAGIGGGVAAAPFVRDACVSFILLLSMSIDLALPLATVCGGCRPSESFTLVGPGGDGTIAP